MGSSLLTLPKKSPKQQPQPASFLLAQALDHQPRPANNCELPTTPC